MSEAVVVKETAAGTGATAGTLLFRGWLQKLNTAQKLALFGLALGGVTLLLTVKLFRRKRRSLQPQKRSLRAARRARTLSTTCKSLPSVTAAAAGDNLESFRKSNYNWAELQRQSMEAAAAAASCGNSHHGGGESHQQHRGDGDTESIATLVDGTPLTPQQLGLMGMEALETVVGYWEDALSAYRPTKSRLCNALTTPEETEFIRSLESILEGAFQLQEEAEHIFIHEHSILNRKSLRSSYSIVDSSDGKSFVSAISGRTSSGANQLLSVSTVDNESFVSAQETIADLKDFDDLNDILNETDVSQELYVQSMAHLEEYGIPYRTIRTEFVGCENDTEYLGKLHCLRIAFKHLMLQEHIRNWWIDSGRQILSELLIRCEKDPKDFVIYYDDLMEFLSEEENLKMMTEELEARNVKCTNFYDVVLDYILIDSFEDLEAPPSSVLAVMKNRWLSNGFKESALQAAIWSVLKTKRRLLRYQNGFKARFYNITEILTPILAWGFFGPDESLNATMNYFKDETLGFIRDLFNFSHIRYTTVEQMAEDIMHLARKNFENTLQYLQLSNS